MSAFDPKRTLAGPSRYHWLKSLRCAGPDPWGSNEAARVHQSNWQCEWLHGHSLQHVRSNLSGSDVSACYKYQAADDAERQAYLAAFRQELERLGWADGRNIQIDYRWGAGNAADTRKYATELVALTPDVIFTIGSASMPPLLQATGSVPIVFALVADPVGAGFVNSLARPGGNATGFISVEYTFGGKWLELLKEIAPNVTHVVVIRDPADPAGIGVFSAVQSAASSARVELSPANVRDVDEVDRATSTFARSNGGLILAASSLAYVHRDAIVALAARHKLPAVYFARPFVTAGGLISYGVDVRGEQFRLAAGYIDRILKR